MFVDDLLERPVCPVVNKDESFKAKLTRDLAWLTLFAYMLLMFKPVMPVVADKIAHTFWLKYHLLTVHVVNGKHHVHIDIDNAEKQSNKDQSTSNSKTSSDADVHLVSANTYNFLSSHFVSRPYLPYKFHSPISYPDIDYQPPKV